MLSVLLKIWIRFLNKGMVSGVLTLNHFARRRSANARIHISDGIISTLSVGSSLTSPSSPGRDLTDDKAKKTVTFGTAFLVISIPPKSETPLTL